MRDAFGHFQRNQALCNAMQYKFSDSTDSPDFPWDFPTCSDFLSARSRERGCWCLPNSANLVVHSGTAMRRAAGVTESTGGRRLGAGVMHRKITSASRLARDDDARSSSLLARKAGYT